MRFLLLALAVSLAGCSSLDDLYRQTGRSGPRTADSRAGSDVRRDVDRYVREVDRAVRLDSRQERQVFELLEDRAYRASRGRDRRDAYPFPRNARPSRDAERFWKDADRRIERVLDRRQRDQYRDFTDRFERRNQRGRRDRRDQRGRRGRN